VGHPPVDGDAAVRQGGLLVGLLVKRRTRRNPSHRALRFKGSAMSGSGAGHAIANALEGMRSFEDMDS